MPKLIVSIHCHCNIARSIRFVDGKEEFVAINGRIDVIGWRKPDTLLIDEEAVVAEVIVL